MLIYDSAVIIGLKTASFSVFTLEFQEITSFEVTSFPKDVVISGKHQRIFVICEKEIFVYGYTFGEDTISTTGKFHIWNGDYEKFHRNLS